MLVVIRRVPLNDPESPGDAPDGAPVAAADGIIVEVTMMVEIGINCVVTWPTFTSVLPPNPDADDTVKTEFVYIVKILDISDGNPVTPVAL